MIHRGKTSSFLLYLTFLDDSQVLPCCQWLIFCLFYWCFLRPNLDKITFLWYFMLLLNAAFCLFDLFPPPPTTQREGEQPFAPTFTPRRHHGNQRRPPAGQVLR